MVGVVAAFEEVVVGDDALVADTIPELNRTLEIGDTPGLTIGCGGVGAKERAWGIQAQLAAELGDLLGGQLGAVATSALVVECSDATTAVGVAPKHQAGARAAGDFGDLDSRVAHAVEADSLQARTI